MPSDREFSSASDDADALVADLLQLFSYVDSGWKERGVSNLLSPARGPTVSKPAVTPPPLLPVTATSDTRELKAFAVQVPPPPSSDEEYEFLPGHSTVRQILNNKHTSRGLLYMVELESSDKEWMTPSQLASFLRGPESLSYFKKHGPPMTIGQLTRKREDTMAGSRSKMQRQEGFVSSENDDDVIVTGTRRARLRGRPSLRLTVRPSQSYASDDDDDEPSSSSNTDESITRPIRRSTRTTNQTSIPRTSFWSSDENGSSDDVLSNSSVTIPKRRRSGGNILLRTSRRLRTRKSESDSDTYAPRGVRFSTRNRISHRNNLRERLEDDISENETAPAEKKFSGAKEIFHKLPLGDPFRLRHRNVCDTCSVAGDDRQKGSLVFCQGCTSAFHKSCLGPRGNRDHLVTKVGFDQFVLQCRRCIGFSQKKDSTAPHLGQCVNCESESAVAKPFRERLNPRLEQQQREKNGGIDPVTTVDEALIDNIDNVLFRCVNCTLAYHFEHLPPNSEDSQVQDTESLSVAEIANARFKEYCTRWMCHTCLTVPGEIETLIAWRPVDADSYTPGFTADVLDETEKEYLVKWKRKSYYRASWMPGAWIWGTASHSMRKAFIQSPKGLKPHMTTEDAIPEEYLRVDIVFDVRYTNIVNTHTMEIDMARVHDAREAYVKFKGLLYEDAVWETVPTPNDSERWDDFTSAYEDWVLRDYVRMPKPSSLMKYLATVRAQDFKSTLVKKSQPSCLTGGQIMEYQLDGLNWLYYMWYKGQNAILADEMGLGKTIQIIAFLATLIQDHKCWPFLVVVPNSTCPNWRREVKKWAPSLRVVTFYGSGAARKIAHDYELFPNGATDIRCHIVVTSYESMVEDKARRVLAGVSWAGLVVDEGQRLKNDKTLLYGALSRINFPFKVLLTGTPLQNNTRELFNLIQFCDPTKNAEELEQKYQTLTKETVPELHDLIRPFFLRRTKAQVLTFLPPMAQIIVPVSMSIVQKKLYKSILAKNSKLIKSIFQKDQSRDSKPTERHSLSNILMQLRKCLCHPFVYSRAIEERTLNAVQSHRNLVEACGKLQLLEHMLPKLRERGHRVLLFSQFLGNLDIMEDFLDGLGLLYCRLDGSLSAHQKQKRIDDFNAPNSQYFAFLLSTRSGGVGINLATADTVIIMDPDFNPHQDIQALSRAHRIGQQKKVLVFQLMTRASAEEKIMQIGKKKMALDHVLIEQMDAGDDVGVDLESILRHGAEALFEDDGTGDIHYDSDSVGKLLDRSQAENTEVGQDASAESQFSFARVWANDSGALEDRLGDSDASTRPNSTLWEKILQDREKAALEEAAAQAESLGRGKRKRNVVDYKTVTNREGSPLSKVTKVNEQPDSDVEFTAKASATDEDSDEGEFAPDEITPVKKAKGRQFKRVDPTKISAPSLDGNFDLPPPGPDRPFPCVACSQSHPVGYCPLKLAGVEHCGLCGLAHIGFQRTCPHINSEAQILSMLQSLRQSTEPRWLIDQARQYLHMVKHDLRKKKAQSRSQLTMSNSEGSGGPYRRPDPGVFNKTTISDPPDPSMLPAQLRAHQMAQPNPSTFSQPPPAGFMPHTAPNPTRGPPLAQYPTGFPGYRIGTPYYYDPHGHPAPRRPQYSASRPSTADRP